MLELGILKTWNSTTHKAGVQLVGSLTTYLDNIAVATNIASSAMVVGNYVLVAIPGGNPRDACVVASWPAGSSGGGGGGTKIQDADGDTSWDVEQSADEDKIHGKVKGVEAFLIHDDGIIDYAKQSGASVYLHSAQSIAGTTPTIINFDYELFDIQSEFNTGNHRFTAKKAGIYFVILAVMYNSNFPDGKGYGVMIYKNADFAPQASAFYTSGATFNCSGVVSAFIQLAANDYIIGKTNQYSGSSQALEAVQGETYFQIMKVA